ncbi:hypothetical protein NQ843_18610, partial [Acinetobacter baumannii]|nr:hypothetical protein [Acinetobacter baumannii]
RIYSIVRDKVLFELYLFVGTLGIDKYFIIYPENMGQETELHYNRYRYYDPHSSRYMSKDPIGLEDGLNTSAYVNNPT